MSYKLPTGLPQDPKLMLLARKTGLSRGAALAIWITLIDYAAQARPRGSLKALKADEIAAVLECPPSDVEALLAALKEKKMLSTDGAIAHWGKYQKLSTPRVRAHRVRQVQRAAEETEAARLSRLRQSGAAARRKKPAAFL